jgi:molybdate transport system substrate-binding protein
LNHIKLFSLMVGGLLLASTGCGGAATPRRGRGHVRVAAAADLNAALGTLVARFRASHDVDVSVSYGSSGTFYSQLLNRAPYDVFLSADLEYPRQLAARGLTIPGQEFTYAMGRLVLWVRASSPADLEHAGLQSLTESTVTRVAVANPEHAPYGRAAVAALQAAGIADRVRPKLVYGENVAQALQFVQSGAAEAGLVALSLALAPNLQGEGRWVEVPPALYPRMEQGGTILQWAADLESAKALRAFLLADDGRALLKQYGFFLPGM